MFTVFHLFEFIGAIVGTISGLAFGQKEFGWTGALLGIPLGFYVGLALGRLPYFMAVAWMRRGLKKCDTPALKRRLEREYFLSHLIIAELVVRGEPVEQFREYVLSLVHSDSPDERRFGEQNIRIWFPESAPTAADEFKPKV